jgi:hypothetical protein
MWRGTHGARSGRSPRLVREWRHGHGRQLGWRGAERPVVRASRVHGEVARQGGEQCGSLRHWLDICGGGGWPARRRSMVVEELRR